MHWLRLLAWWSSVGLLTTVLLGLPATWAQSPAVSPASGEIDTKQTVLLSLLRSITQLEKDLAAKQEELRSPEAAGRQEELTQQLRTMREQLTLLNNNFRAFASGVDLQVFTEPQEVERDWTKELHELLRPVLHELRQFTALPREIDRLRTEMARYQEQVAVATQALANLEMLLQHHPAPGLTTSLRQQQQDWAQRRQELNTQVSLVNQQLMQKLSQRRPVSGLLTDLFQLFFRSRGRNFLFACLAGGLFVLGLRWVYRWLQRLSPLHRQDRAFVSRVAHVGYIVVAALGAITVFQLVLYAVEDWVLLTVSLFFLLGLIWTSKHALPRFWQQGMLLLNLGAVREGERLFYQGVPWLVHSLHAYTRLINPELTGGDVRLPLHDVLGLRSRAFASQEPWFPTHQGDWILLADQSLGRVSLQTPEVVRLVLLGGSIRTFRTPDFLAQSPTVLSTGFRLEVRFGLGAQAPRLVTREIPSTLAARLREDLAREGYGEDLVHLHVEFEDVEATALNVRVIGDFAGTAAPRYGALRRAIQRSCVEACSSYGWAMLFPQLTGLMTAAAAQPPLSGSNGPHEEGGL